MARATMTKGGLPLHVPAMCSAVAGVTPCLHPHEHKAVCIHQCCIMGVTLQRLFAPFQGGGFLTAHHGLFFYLLQVPFSLPNNPMFVPRIIQALKNPVSPLMLYLLHSCCKELPKPPPLLTHRRVHCPVLSHGRCHCKELSPPFQGERSWQHKMDWHVLFSLTISSVY